MVSGGARGRSCFEDLTSRFKVWSVVLRYNVLGAGIIVPPAGGSGIADDLQGVEYEIALIKPGLWKWQFRIGDAIVTGTTKTNLGLLAERRLRMAINRELRASSARLQRAAQ